MAGGWAAYARELALRPVLPVEALRERISYSPFSVPFDRDKMKVELCTYATGTS